MDSSMPTPPVALEMERAVLGALLIDREAIVAVASWLFPAHFYLQKHGWIYEAALACVHERIASDIPAVAEALRRRGRLDMIGGITFLADLATDVATAVYIEHYAQKVVEAAQSRALIDAGGKIAALGYTESRPLAERLDEAESQLFAIVASQHQETFCRAAAVVDEFYEQIRRLHADDASQACPTGYNDLDEIAGGLRSGEMIVLGARPGVGKTALLLNLAYHLAHSGYGVGMFSLEMDRTLLIQRLTAMIAGCSGDQVARRVRDGDANVLDAMAAVAGLPIWIDHTESLDVLDIRSRARRLALHESVGIWMVDYLQLATARTSRDDVQRVGLISSGLAKLARELRQPVLVASQLSRAVENRVSKVPTLADLRWSGEIEQDASQVWFLYRDEVYDPQSAKKGIAELHIAKNRNGQTGVVPLRFDAQTTRFADIGAVPGSAMPNRR
jgi:replicative DNA helicase